MRPDGSKTCANWPPLEPGTPPGSPKFVLDSSRPADTTAAWARSAASVVFNSSEPRRAYRKVPAAANRHAMLAAKASVSRSLIGRCTASLRPQPVPGSSDRVDRSNPEGSVDLVPQVFHVDIDDVRTAVVSEVPNVLD